MRNREQKNARKKERIICECGTEICRSSKSTHQKSQTHLDKIQEMKDKQTLE